MAETKWNMKRVVNTTTKEVKDRATATRNKALYVTKVLVARSVPGVSKVKLPDPPVPHLLQSNTPPSDSQAILISNALVMAEAERQHLANMIASETNASLGRRTAFKHNLEQVTEFIRQQKAILSPVRRLPEEILEELFRYMEIANPKSHTGKSWSNIPWALGHICRAWRASALAASFLWNSLPPIHLDKTVGSKHRADIINELLIRSGGRPLEKIYIDCWSDITGHPIIDMICRHSERWQVLFFNSTRTTLAAFSTIKGRLHCLKKLTLAVSGEPSDGVSAPSFDMFEDAPLLRELCVYETYPRQLTLLFSQLVSYQQPNLRGNPAPEEPFISPFLKNLTVLELYGNISSLPAIDLPHLVKLRISSTDESSNIAFLDSLTLPVIEEIKIDTIRGNELQGLIDMMARSPNRYSLKNLSVRDNSMLPGDMTTLLKLAPGLFTLDITIPPASDIYKLATGDEDVPLAPLLKACSFYIHGGPVPAETSRALRVLASLRCETSVEDGQESDRNNFLIFNELQPIGALRIYFDSPFIVRNTRQGIVEGWNAIMQQAALENWSASAKSFELQALRRRLHRSLPSYHHGPKLDKKWFENVDGILTNIELMDILDPKDIYLSEIHFSVKRLSQLVIWNDDKLNISTRAADILKKWNLLFEQNLEDRHWVFQGTHSMIYVPNNHPIRKTQDALNIVYGLSGSRRLETFWTD